MSFDPTKPSTTEGTIADALDSTRANLGDLNDRVSAQENLALAALKNEVVAARGTKGSVKDRLTVSLDDAGNLKFDSLRSLMWAASGDVPSYVSSLSFTVPGDKTTTYLPGMLLRLAHGAANVYAAVSVASYASGPALTTVNLRQPVLTASLSAVSLGLASIGQDDPVIPRRLRLSVKPSYVLYPVEGLNVPQIGASFVRSGPAKRINRRGQIESASANVVRQQYDPLTKGLMGWSLEGSRTNIRTYSKDQSNAVWTKTGATVTADAANGPDGLATADKVVEDSSNGLHGVVFSGLACSAETTYAVSYKLAVGERFKGRIRVGTNVGFLDDVYFDLVALTATSYAGNPCGIKRDGNGYYLVWISAKTQVGATSFSQTGLYLYNNSGVSSYIGDGASGLYVGSVQVEAGSYPTSHIDTTTTATTRAADQLTVDPAEIGLPTDGRAFSISGEFVLSDGLGLSEWQNLFMLHDGTENNLVEVYRQEVSGVARFSMRVRSGGSTTALMFVNVASTNIRVRFSLRSAENDFAVAVAVEGVDLGNGSGVAVMPAKDTSGSAPAALSALVIANNYSFTRPSNSVPKRLMFYDLGLADSDLLALSSFA